MLIEELEAEELARELAALLRKGLDEHAYERLAILAPPRFLGTMRGAVGAEVEKRLTPTIDEDLTNLDVQELMKRLDTAVARDRAPRSAGGVGGGRLLLDQVAQQLDLLLLDLQ